MRGRLVNLAMIAVWGASLLAGSAKSASKPSLPEYVAEQLRSALPGYEVTVADSLTLKLGKRGAPASELMQLNLDRVADYCTRVPDSCTAEVADLIHKTVPIVQAQNWSPDSAALRAVVRPENYVAQMASMLKTTSDTFISTQFAGDLVMMCYFDMPTAMRPVTIKDLTALGMEQATVIETCQRNMRAALPKLPENPPPDFARGPALGYLQGNPYESGYLLLHDDWAPLARALGGHLLVAAPGADLILYGNDTGPTSVDALATLARQTYGQAERPISTTVFRWTPSGWDVVTP